MSLADLSYSGRAPQTLATGMRAIVSELAAAHGVPEVAIMTGRRPANVAIRQEACWRARHELGQSWGQIGRFFGKDHTTAIHAVRAHEKRRG